MSMSKQRYTEIIEVMLTTSGLEPDWEHDFFGNSSFSGVARFINGFCDWFSCPRDHWAFAYNNLEWCDCPSDAVEFFVNNRDELTKNFEKDAE